MSLRWRVRVLELKNDFPTPEAVKYRVLSLMDQFFVDPIDRGVYPNLFRDYARRNEEILDELRELQRYANETRMRVTIL